MIAVVAGATGLVGTNLVQKILADREFTEVLSVSRKSLHITDPKLREILIQDLSELPKQASYLKGDVYFCALGTTIKDAGTKEQFKKVDHDAIVAFANIAQANEARSFVLVSAAGANPNSPFFYNRIKGDTESDLRRLKLKSLVIFRPSLLIGDRKVLRKAEKMFIKAYKRIAPVLPAPLKKNLGTDVSELAQAMLAKGKAAPPGVSTIGPKEI